MWRGEAGISPAAAVSLGPGSAWLKTAVSVRVSEDSRSWNKWHTETELWGWDKGAPPQLPSDDVPKKAINSFPALGPSCRSFAPLFYGGVHRQNWSALSTNCTTCCHWTHPCILAIHVLVLVASFLGHWWQFLTHFYRAVWKQQLQIREFSSKAITQLARGHHYSYCANESHTCSIQAFFWCSFSLVKESLENTTLRLQSKRHPLTSAVQCLLFQSCFEKAAALLWQTFLRVRKFWECLWESIVKQTVTYKCWCLCYQFKEMHSATHLAAVIGPGLVLWKSMLEPESFSTRNAALTIWFRQFWCMSSIIRSASSMIWIHKDEKHYLLNTV